MIKLSIIINSRDDESASIECFNESVKPTRFEVGTLKQALEQSGIENLIGPLTDLAKKIVADSERA